MKNLLFASLCLSTCLVYAGETFKIDVYPPAKNESALTVLNNARSELRSWISAHPETKKIEVILHNGTYFLPSSFELNSLDTIKNGQVVWKGESDKVRIIGAKIAVFEAGKITNVRKLNLKATKITALSKMKPSGFRFPEVASSSEIFSQRAPLKLSRHPNSGWLKIKNNRGNTSLSVDQSIAVDFKVSDPMFLGYWGNDYAHQYISADSVSEGFFNLVAPLPIYPMKKNHRVALLNTVEYLDSPGEYAISKDGNLFVYPPQNDPTLANEYLISLTETPLIVMKDCSGIKWEGVEIGYTRGSAVQIINGSKNSFVSSLIINTGLEGLSIKGGQGNEIRGNKVQYTGNESIIVDGGDRKTLRPGQHLIDNNDLKNFGRIGKTYYPGVEVRGVGNTISHNEIAHGPHFAIRFLGNDHKIEYNHVYAVVQETSDAGAFYIGRDWSERGTVIRHNYIHNIGTNLGGPGTMAVYLDDLASGVSIIGNYFYDAGRCAFVGGGRDNMIKQNIFINCSNSIHVDQRGIHWNVDFFYGANIEMVPKIERMNYRNPPYSTSYPKLAIILEDSPLEAKGNVAERNLMLNSSPNYTDAVVTQINNRTIDQFNIPVSGLPTPRALKAFIKATSPNDPLNSLPAEAMGLQPDIFRSNLTNRFKNL